MDDVCEPSDGSLSKAASSSSDEVFDQLSALTRGHRCDHETRHEG